ncbi:exported hypothetical protein [Candidatus Sulfopaludibacter sp. SbA3]|nr:exported hypothetical protein [Candidatus Sulfopaludibacter sp. SbA3]
MRNRGLRNLILIPMPGSRFLLLSMSWVVAAQSPPADLCGIYDYTEHLAQDAQLVTRALGVPGVDGLTLLAGWVAFEPDSRLRRRSLTRRDENDGEKASGFREGANSSRQRWV